MLLNPYRKTAEDSPAISRPVVVGMATALFIGDITDVLGYFESFLSFIYRPAHSRLSGQLMVRPANLFMV